MATTYVLYNPIAGHGADQGMDRLKSMIEGEIRMLDVTGIKSYTDFVQGLSQKDRLLIAGGDGTLNRFVNAIDGLDVRNEILYYPVGSGNDFAHDLGYEKGCAPFAINAYIKDLPVLTIGEKSWRFFNGVGFGLDGYVCQAGNAQREKTGKTVSYTSVALRSLLFEYKPTNAKVTVDGVICEYKKVWLAPTMFGRYFGGGMKIAPDQDRGNAERTVTSILYSGRGRLFTLCIFPTIYKGKHVRFKKDIIIRTGHEVTVEFDRAETLQIDGETIAGVTAYSVKV